MNSRDWKEISVPKSIFTFHSEPLPHSSWIIPVFQETSSKDVRNLFQIEEEIFPQNSFFSKRAGEIYQFKNWIFLGLGEKRAFHPEVLVHAFRALGYLLSHSGPGKVTISIPAYVETVIEKFSKLEKENLNDPWKHRYGKEYTSRDRIFFDYVMEYSLQEAIKTIIYAIETGGFSLGIYKSSASSRSREVAIGFATSLPQNDLNALIKEGKTLGELTNGYRYLSFLPGNILNPETYESFIKKNFLGRIMVTVIKDKALENKRMFGVLSVGQGSKTPPRVIILEYDGRRSKRKPLLLVGKGITFDTGGISLKPPQGMYEMKYDMSGSALVLYSMLLASAMDVPFSIIGIIGLAENIPDANAYRPGDVYKTMTGMTVEIHSTDAEGRLILGDLMAYGIYTYKPGMVLDFATLTSSCIVALGNYAAGVMTASDTLYQKIERASKISLERVWRLPHWSIYDELLGSDIADIKNTGGKNAGAITAMRFISNFVPTHIPWAHFDIAGVAWMPSGPEYAKGPTGWGIRFMNAFFKELY